MKKDIKDDIVFNKKNVQKVWVTLLKMKPMELIWATWHLHLKKTLDWFSHSPVKVFEESKCIWWARLNKNFGKKLEFKSIREKIQTSMKHQLKIKNL